MVSIGRTKQRKNTWLRQLVTIYNKGITAKTSGVSRNDCPYNEGYRNQNGNGGSLQRQRRQAWLDGYDRAKTADGIPLPYAKKDTD